ncbi:MAG: hypothetical protein FWD99_06190 [Oscillospiraceae bacterium]|nr:hypothetical protein [Oscillospiraceae bacterium]
MNKIRTVKMLVLGVILATALVMGSMAIAQISATDDYLVDRLADIADHPGYVIRDLDGYIAVYFRGRGHPVYITGIPVANLRGVDRTSVEKGITVETRQEMIEILEDFGS